MPSFRGQRLRLFELASLNMIWSASQSWDYPLLFMFAVHDDIMVFSMMFKTWNAEPYASSLLVLSRSLLGQYKSGTVFTTNIPAFPRLKTSIYRATTSTNENFGAWDNLPGQNHSSLTPRPLQRVGREEKRHLALTTIDQRSAAL